MTIAKTCSRCSFETQVSNYDRLTGWLMALIIVCGAMLVIFVTLLLRERSTSRPPPPIPVPGTLILPGEIDADNLVDPGTEAPELVSEVIDLTQFETDVLSTARAQSAMHWRGTSDAPGDGDHRGVGPPNPTPDPPKRPGSVSQRWKITYELSDMDAYAAQLRFFEIELGLVSKNTNDIWRIAGVGQQNHVSRSSRKAEGKSLYFVSSNARMARWDKSFAVESGVGTQGCDLNNIIQVHFYPAATVELLKGLEQNAIPGDKLIEQVRETNFRLVNRDEGFEFEVTKIKFE